MAAIPHSFERAYQGLHAITSRLDNVSVTREELDSAVGTWLQEDCNGLAVMGQAAIFALRAELTATGLQEGPDPSRDSLILLQRIEASLTGTGQDPETAEIREVAVPPQLRAASATMRAFVMGEAEILMSNDQGNLVVSVKHPNRPLTWSELMRARSVVPEPVPRLFAYLPAPGEQFGVGGHTGMLTPDPRVLGLI